MTTPEREELKPEPEIGKMELECDVEKLAILIHKKIYGGTWSHTNDKEYYRNQAKAIAADLSFLRIKEGKI
jgi:hypothetical protein